MEQAAIQNPLQLQPHVVDTSLRYVAWVETPSAQAALQKACGFEPGSASAETLLTTALAEKALDAAFLEQQRGQGGSPCESLRGLCFDSSFCHVLSHSSIGLCSSTIGRRSAPLSGCQDGVEELVFRSLGGDLKLPEAL